MNFKTSPETERCFTHLMYISPIYRYNKKIRIYIKQSNHNSPFSTFNSQLKKRNAPLLRVPFFKKESIYFLVTLSLATLLPALTTYMPSGLLFILMHRASAERAISVATTRPAES